MSSVVLGPPVRVVSTPGVTPTWVKKDTIFMFLTRGPEPFTQERTVHSCDMNQKAMASQTDNNILLYIMLFNPVTKEM